VSAPTVILWLDEAPVYRAAAERAGLAARARLHAVPAGGEPPADLLAHAEGLLAWRVPPRAC